MNFNLRLAPSAIGLFFGLLFSVTIASPAQATPIPFLGGTLEASLRLYDLEDIPGNPYVVRKDYVLGTDFFPGVPPSTGVYHSELDPHAQAVFAGFFPPAVSLETGCNGSPFSGGGSIPNSNVAYMIVRGVCSFDEKWENVESQGFLGGIMVNNVPGSLLSFTGLGGITSPKTIPFFLVTEEVGAELHGGSSADGHFGLFPIISMSVTWTPGEVADVPEPSTLVLALIGGVGASARRWRTRRRRR